MQIRNVAHLPKAMTTILSAETIVGGRTLRRPWGQKAAVIIERPWERQPCGIVKSDPFTDLTCACRVVMPASAMKPTTRETLEPSWHVLLEDVREACMSVLPNKPSSPLAVLSHRTNFEPRITLGLDADATLGAKAIFPGSDNIIGDSWYDVLYTSVVLEVASRMLSLPMGRLAISWHTAMEEVGLLDQIAGCEKVQDGYSDERFQSSSLVSDDAARWVLETDMLRGDVIGLVNPMIRTIVAPMMAAGKAFNNDGVRDFDGACKAMTRCKSADWVAAGHDWIEAVVRAHG